MTMTSAVCCQQEGLQTKSAIPSSLAPPIPVAPSRLAGWPPFVGLQGFLSVYVPRWLPSLSPVSDVLQQLLDSGPDSLPTAAAGRLSPAEGLVTGTLPNGLSFVILPNRDPPDTIVTYLQVNAGSINETERQQVLFSP